MSLPATPAPEPREPDPLESCLRRYQEGEYAEALEAATSALRSESGEPIPSAPSFQRAALWGLAGLARQALGDRDGAGQAFEAGLGCAPALAGPSAPPEAMSLAVLVARLIVESAEAAAEASADVMAGLGLARALGEAGAAAEPSDDTLREILARAQEAGFALVDRPAKVLLDRREFDEARRLIEEALGSPDLPAARREALCELLWTSVTGEVGRLTGEAFESAGDVSEALALLDRAEEAIRQLPPDAFTGERQEDLRRRIWWGHTKLGVARTEAGNPEAALPPLYRALGLPDMDAERQTQTRRALAQALEAVADKAEAAVAGLLGEGDRPGAEARGQALCRVIDEAFEQGLSQEELMVAIARRQHVMGLIAGVEGA